MTIVTDAGFAAEDWQHGFSSADNLDRLNPAQQSALALDLPGDFPADELTPWLDQIDLIRIDFGVFSDGRGFSLARHLRMLGYCGRLRAKGGVIADQYAMARGCGFDEVEITPELAARQPAPQWRYRRGDQQGSYLHRMRQFA